MDPRAYYYRGLASIKLGKSDDEINGDFSEGSTRETMGRGGGNLPNGQAGGFLGKAHDPFALMADPSKKDFRVPDLLPPDQIAAHRLERRRRMREQSQPYSVYRECRA